MENEKFTPTDWHWKITPEQIEKIKQRDRDTVNAAYFDNLDKFERMAKKYCNIIKRRDLVEDCTQQIYADMHDYDYTNRLTLWRSIYHSFWRACRVGRCPVLSLDKPLTDDTSDTLGDLLPSPYDAAREVENRENERHVLEVIAAQTQLTENGRDILTAMAFGCAAKRGLFAYALQTLAS